MSKWLVVVVLALLVLTSAMGLKAITSQQPGSDGKHQRTNASYAVVAGEHQRTDAAHTVGEHQCTDAADALGQHERADAAYTVGEHQRSNAADALEIG